MALGRRARAGAGAGGAAQFLFAMIYTRAKVLRKTSALRAEIFRDAEHFFLHFRLSSLKFCFCLIKALLVISEKALYFGRKCAKIVRIA